MVLPVLFVGTGLASSKGVKVLNSKKPALVDLCRSFFESVPDHRTASKKIQIPLVDYLMAAFGIFTLKYPSLLLYDKEMRQQPLSGRANNFKSLFGIKKVPDDTTLRQTLDKVNPEQIKPVFKKIFNHLRENKKTDRFQFYKGSFLVALDGTGYFSSSKVHCENCCVKNHKDGKKTYYHQMMSAAIINPELKIVLPLAPEPIHKKDGNTKNDCELNASKRLLKQLRADFPRTDFTITEDGLSANYPHVQELMKHKFNFILMIKPGNHKSFFQRMEDDLLTQPRNKHRVEVSRKNKKYRQDYRYLNNIVLLEGHEDVVVNYFECVETDSKGKSKTFSWITNFEVNHNNIEKLASGGRSRWKIENEVFNTLKNQGYAFEHNFGHGKMHLSTVFAFLMVLSFLVDQANELVSASFQEAKLVAGPKYNLWEKIRGIFEHFEVDSWETVYNLVSGKVKLRATLDTC